MRAMPMIFSPIFSPMFSRPMIPAADFVAAGTDCLYFPSSSFLRHYYFDAAAVDADLFMRRRDCRLADAASSILQITACFRQMLAARLPASRWRWLPLHYARRLRQRAPCALRAIDLPSCRACAPQIPRALLRAAPRASPPLPPPLS